MSDPSVPRATNAALGPAAAVNSTNREEPIAVDSEQDSRARESDEKTERDERDTDFEKAESHESDAGFEKTKSAAEAKPIGEPLAPYATSASGASATTTVPTVAAKKPWYKTPNPMKWGSIPPIPTERGVSREATAGWFSLLTFQWMAPVMTVSALCSHAQLQLLTPGSRLATNDHSTRTTSGSSTPSAKQHR